MRSLIALRAGGYAVVRFCLRRRLVELRRRLLLLWLDLTFRAVEHVTEAGLIPSWCGHRWLLGRLDFDGLLRDGRRRELGDRGGHVRQSFTTACACGGG